MFISSSNSNCNSSNCNLNQSNSNNDNNDNFNSSYRGRLAPTPSGEMHLGHAQTFYIAWKRSQINNGKLILRIEDLDQQRCRSHYLEQFINDLHWFGITWDEGPQNLESCLCNNYIQSQRHDIYLKTWKILYDNGYIYPSKQSRREISSIISTISAPHEENNISAEPIFPEIFRVSQSDVPKNLSHPGNQNWRFRVPDGREVSYNDQRCGIQKFTCGIHFGDFLIWRCDGFPSYELAVVVDDIDMKITEVVRGEDLLLSTARQILIYEALIQSSLLTTTTTTTTTTTINIPSFYHCPLVRDDSGIRLAKRTSPMKTISNLRQNGWEPEQIRKELLPYLNNDIFESKQNILNDNNIVEIVESNVK